MFTRPLSSAQNIAQDYGIPRTAYPQYEGLEWVPPAATPQESAPIYRPQPRYGWYLRTLSPQPRQAPDYRPKAAPAVVADTPVRPWRTGPIGARNSELDLGRAQPGAPRVIVAGENAALASASRSTFRPTR